MTPRKFSCISIGSIAAKRISEDGFVGKVHSIFDKSFAMTGRCDGLVFFVRHDVARGPLNVVVDLDVDLTFASLSMSVGDAVIRQRDSLFVGRYIEIRLCDARVWTCTTRLPQVASPLRVNEKIDALKVRVLELGNHGGLGQLVRYESQIIRGETIPDEVLPMISAKVLPHLRSLVSAIISEDLRTVENSAKSLVGLGIGLTPSGDDVLAGIMAGVSTLLANFSIDDRYITAVNGAIISHLQENRTNLISKEFLVCAARGQFVENVASLIMDVLSPSENLINSKIQVVLKMGETSGTDITLGIILGLRLGLQLIEPKNRTDCSNAGRLMM